MFRVNLGADAPNVGMTLFCNGNVKSTIGKNNDALLDYREALRITKANLGENHPDCAVILHNTANVYGVMVRFYLVSFLRGEQG